MEDLTEASLDDISHFFATYYTPDNAVLSIAGDFDPAEARRLVEEYYGPIPRGTGRPPLPPMDVPATFGESRREVVEDAVMLPRLYLAFRSPVFGSDAYYAASVCGAIIGMRRGSRLQRALVRERQIAADATEIDLLQADGVTDAEVERAVALIETDFVTSMQAAGERADKLSMFATYFGDPSLLNEQVDRYRRVRTADVNAFIAEQLGAN